MKNRLNVKHLAKKLNELEHQHSGTMTLAELRKNLHLSQKAFGELLGLSRDAIAQYERGRRTPAFTVDQIRKLQLLLQEIGKNWEDLANDLSNPEKLNNLNNLNNNEQQQSSF